MRGGHGYTVIELLVATAVLLAATGGVFRLLDEGVARSALWNEAADLHQRGRVGVDALSSVISAAGGGRDTTSLARSFATVEPRRRTAGGVSPGAITVRYAPDNAPVTTLAAPLGPGEQVVRIARHAGCADGTVACGFHPDMTVVIFDRAGNWDTVVIQSIAPDTLTVIDRPVPRTLGYDTGAQVMQLIETALYFEPADGTLRREHASTSNLPLLDNVVDVKFEYYGDPMPPVVPRPPAGVANCLYDAAGARLPLPTLTADHGELATLSLATLGDGPMCGTGATAYDVDLLRIRKIRASLHLQTGVAMLRGSDPRLFAQPGPARAPGRMLPDVNLRLAFTPPNLQR